MPSKHIIICDNTFYMQNQDYTSSRYFCQRNAIYDIISGGLKNEDSEIGIFPIAQNFENMFLTPTNKRDIIDRYISQMTITNRVEIEKIIEIILLYMLNYKADYEVSIFIGHDIGDFSIFERLMENKIKVYLFGEACEKLEGTDIPHVNIRPGDNFSAIPNRPMDDESNDEMLQKALELSMKEK